MRVLALALCALIAPGCHSNRGTSTPEAVPSVSVLMLDAAAMVRPGTFTVDPDLARTAASKVRLGAVADGVSRLVLRATTSGVGTVSFGFVTAGTDDELGTLEIPGAGGQVATSTGPGGAHAVACVYRAPIDFVRASMRAADQLAEERDLVVAVRYTPAAGTAAVAAEVRIRLRRPPVVLCHGLNSSAKTWDGPFARWNDTIAGPPDPRVFTHALDYQSTNTASFGRNMDAVKRGIDAALARARAVGFAAVQVDWVGHSMGGVLPRFYYRAGIDRTYGQQWRREDNFGAGDLHKLILLNSPQWGSPWGNALAPLLPNALVTAALSLLGFTDLGALRDLATGSDALRTIGRTPIPAFVLMSVGSERKLQSASSVLDIAQLFDPGRWRTLLEVIGTFTSAQASTIYGPARHDLAVLEDSQTAGLPALNRTVYDGFDDYNHLRVTQNSEYFTRVTELLDTPVLEFAAELPEPQVSIASLRGPEARQLRPGALALSVRGVASAVRPGQRLAVEVRCAAGCSPSRVLIVATGGVSQWLRPPFHTELRVPQTVAGQFTVLAFAPLGDREVAAADPWIAPVRIVEPLVSLRAEAEHITLRGSWDRARLHVVGVFAGGIERDLTGPATGTVLTLEPEGIAAIEGEEIRGLSTGTAWLTAAHGTHTVRVRIDVRATD
ncbi:MAG: hypothetical protein KDC87_01795 [Planctomycetes bacterium]|nr:hypothetical protein [Planctomycetota bacterium]